MMGVRDQALQPPLLPPPGNANALRVSIEILIVDEDQLLLSI
jgi:hypothetical protein